MMIDLKKKYNALISDKKFSEILTGSAYTVVARVGGAGLTMVSSIIVARLYGAKALGILAVVNSFLMLVSVFAVMGTSTSILRLIPEQIVKYSVTSAFRVYRKIQFFVVVVSLIVGTFFFFTSSFMASILFSKPHLTFFFALASGFVVFKSLLDLNTQAVRGLKLIRTFAFMQALPSATMLTILAGCTFLFENPNIPVYSQLAAFSVAAVVGILIMDSSFKKKITSRDLVQPLALRRIVSISLPMLTTTSMFLFTSQTGIIMLGMFRTESEVGFYSVAVKLATLTAFILQAINSMAAPKFAELYHADKVDEMFYVARKSSRLIFWTTVPVLLFLLVLGKPLLNVIFGHEFTVAYAAMVLLVVGQFVNSISGSTGYFMNMTGHEKAFRNIMIVAAVINVFFSWVLIPRFGVEGSAFAEMSTLIFWNVNVLVYIRAKYGRSIGYVPVFLAK
jgi:O-antigen/teichoic acid export membrane protein